MSYASYAKVLRPALEKSYAKLGMGPNPPKSSGRGAGLPMAGGLTPRSYATLRMVLRVLRQGFFGATACQKEPKINSCAFFWRIHRIQGNT